MGFGAVLENDCYILQGIIDNLSSTVEVLICLANLHIRAISSTSVLEGADFGKNSLT